MMLQMESGQPMREDPGYGRYEGNQTYAPPPQYGAGPQYDDEFIDGLAQRLSQRMAQGPRGKIQPTPNTDRVSAGMRLALAIVSITMLIPLAAILLAGVGGITGMLSFGAACFAILFINLVFNNPFHRS
ncbi:MAG: hypothetical protein M3Y39_09980 [Chloroflexota bacterium]|nr:hypothetical protein [Chloroflexota bacterium]